MSDPTNRLAPVVRLAQAKLNLTLAIVGPRPDGYHALHSVVVPLGLTDRLSFAPAPGGRDTLHVGGRDAGPIAENLVLRAIAATRRAVGARSPGPAGPPPPLAVRLEKRIPVAAGLGGGSSDAAAAIDGALEAWGAELEPAERLALAIGLGSDVPFFLAGGPALIEGRGERVTSLAPLRGEPPGVLLVTPAVAVRTPDVFAAWASGIRPPGACAARASSEHLAAELRAGLSGTDLVRRSAVLAAANDLLSATLALVPELVAFRRALARLLGRPIGQSGSGPTCLVLYPSLVEAAAAADLVREALGAGRLPRLGMDDPAIEPTTIAAGPGAKAASDSTMIREE